MISVPEFRECDWYSAAEMCELLGIKDRTLRLWKRTGRIPSEAILRHGPYNVFWYRCDVIDPLIDAGALGKQDSLSLSEIEPQEELIRLENFELLPEHYERCKVFHERYKAGILTSGVPREQHVTKTIPFNQLSVDSGQFSVFSGQLSESVHSPLKTENCPLATIHCPLTTTPLTTLEENPMPQETYTSQEVADLCGVSPRAIGSWFRVGYISKSAVVDKGVYKRAVIDALIADGTLPPNADAPKQKPKRKSKPKIKQPNPDTAEPYPQDVTQDVFIRKFWVQKDRAFKVLTLPPTYSSAVVEYVNEALLYACEEFKLPPF
jgi:hypothetical protein